MTGISNSVTHAVIVRDSVVFRHPWFCESLEEAQAKAEECYNALKPEYHHRVEVLELVRVA
jgi:hypothetical protein